MVRSREQSEPSLFATIRGLELSLSQGIDLQRHMLLGVQDDIH